MQRVWDIIKWAAGYDPRWWAPIIAFLKLWLVLAAIFAAIFAVLYLNGATFVPVD